LKKIRSLPPLEYAPIKQPLPSRVIFDTVTRVFDLFKEIFYHDKVSKVVCMLRRQVDSLLIDYHISVYWIELDELIKGGRQANESEA
jgi:hypothetical protein